MVTGTALANLFVALGKPGLQNACLVITDLTASYQAGAQQIHQALSDLESETGRLAMNLEPVRMNTDEFYHTLRTRTYRGPAREDIDEIAQAYARAVRDARQMDVTNASPEQFARSIAEAYTFHPAIRDLYARFKKNPGFQQARGLIRLMRIVASGLWRDDSDTRYLISAHDIDLNDREVSSTTRSTRAPKPTPPPVRFRPGNPTFAQTRPRRQNARNSVPRADEGPEKSPILDQDQRA